MSEFDKWWDTHCISSNCEEDEAKIHFEAGQQSRQAKIDALQLSNHHLSVQVLDGNEHYDYLKKQRDELQAYINKAQRCLPYYLLDKESSENWIGGVQNKIVEGEVVIDELQGRIDEALTLIYKEKSKVECDTYKGVYADLIIGLGHELHLILKGNKDEN